MVSPGSHTLEVTARSSDNVIMGMSHPEFPLHGVQFHPESFLTEFGFQLVENFLRLGALRQPERQKEGHGQIGA
jgi:anthranilate synthase component 2